MGKIIVFEGMDGCGKDTQIELLIEYFKERNISYKYIPQLNTEIGRVTRSMYLSGKCGDFQYRNRVNDLLFASDRTQYVFEKDGVIDSKNSGDVVILNRFLASAEVYALFNKTDDDGNCCKSYFDYYDFIRMINKPVYDSAYPDITFYLKISPEESMNRIHARSGNVEVYEKKEYSEKIYQEFERTMKRATADKHIVQELNGSDTIDNIQKDIRSFVDQYIIGGNQ